MPPETLPNQPANRRRHIAPERERLQSELLVGGWAIAVLPLALLLLAVRSRIAWDDGKMITGMHMHGVYITLALTAIVIGLRAATPMAALVGGTVCFTMTLTTTLRSSHLRETALPTLTALFLLTFIATRLGPVRKARLGVAESEHGRAPSQIVANLGVASAVALLHGIHSASAVAVVAVLAEATADTVSSEIGPLLPRRVFGRTVLITTLRPVLPGTDGGISLGGTLSGMAGAAIVVTVGVMTMQLTATEWKIAFFAAVAGLFADSLLGATLERRGYIGNDLVNFLSTGVAALIAFPLGVLLLP